VSFAATKALESRIKEWVSKRKKLEFVTERIVVVVDSDPEIRNCSNWNEKIVDGLVTDHKEVR